MWVRLTARRLRCGDISIRADIRHSTRLGPGRVEQARELYLGSIRLSDLSHPGTRTEFILAGMAKIGTYGLPRKLTVTLQTSLRDKVLRLVTPDASMLKWKRRRPKGARDTPRPG